MANVVLPSTVGTKYERGAEKFLIKNNLRTLDRNFRCESGEIDLVMEDSDVVVFVEVRSRRDNARGGPFESITATKQKRIIRAATFYLATRPILQQRACQFDAVGATTHLGRTKYDWIRDAFAA